MNMPLRDPEPGAARSPLAAEIEPPTYLRHHLPPGCRQNHADEKLLLFGGAISSPARSGEEKPPRHPLRLDGHRARAVSRVVTSVMTFEHGRMSQPARHPGPRDFSEDTYRTLTAWILPHGDRRAKASRRHRKLFEVCRLRDIPILTFVNKMDRGKPRPVRDSGRDREAPGARHRADDLALASGRDFAAPSTSRPGMMRRLLDDPPPRRWNPRRPMRWRRTITISTPPPCAGKCAGERGVPGRSTAVVPRRPSDAVYFGQRPEELGVDDLLDGLARLRPAAGAGRRHPPRRGDRPGNDRLRVQIQANMDPTTATASPSRALLRQADARMKVKHVRTQKTMSLRAPQFFSPRIAPSPTRPMRVTSSASLIMARCASATR